MLSIMTFGKCTKYPVLLILLSVTIFWVAGCGKSSEPDPEKESLGETSPQKTKNSEFNQGKTVVSDPLDPKKQLPLSKNPEGQLAKTFGKTLPDLLLNHLSEKDGGIKKTMATFLKRKETVVRPQTLTEIYIDGKIKPLFVDRSGLTPRGVELLPFFEESEAKHALKIKRYHLGPIKANLEALQKANEKWSAQLPAGLDEKQIATLESYIKTTSFNTQQDKAPQKLLGVMLLDPQNPLPELTKIIKELSSSQKKLTKLIGKTELIITDALMRYSSDMKWENEAWLGEVEIEKLGKLNAKRARLRMMVESIDQGESVTELMESLVPPYPQYALLQEARLKYKGYVDAGGWEKVPRHTKLQKGRTHKTVQKLKKRLAIEEYYNGPIDKVFDTKLVDAIKHYQTTHQMKVTGQPHKLFYISLNKPADVRLASIEVTMQRWRESRITDDKYYVFVNIPDFHAEVWKDNNRDMRFKIVVGNTKMECDRKQNIKVYKNATPRQSSKIKYLIYNPYWNVPKRIKREEFDVKLLDDPNHYEANGYEYVLSPGGSPILRQLPGEENALGLVKFIFPNPHSTFMHDTPKKKYFKRHFRAYSHGCMRVENPLDFAEYLLKQDGKWDEKRVAKILEPLDDKKKKKKKKKKDQKEERKRDTTIIFNKQVPIHIEYYVVTVGDDGFVNFLSDVYRLDRARMNPKYKPEKCTPKLITELPVEVDADDDDLGP